MPSWYRSLLVASLIAAGIWLFGSYFNGISPFFLPRFNDDAPEEAVIHTLLILAIVAPLLAAPIALLAKREPKRD